MPALFSFSVGMTPEAQLALVLSGSGVELQQEPLQEQPAEEVKAPIKKRRARAERGTFQADDPATPDVDEAWEEVKEEEIGKTKATEEQA